MDCLFLEKMLFFLQVPFSAVAKLRSIYCANVSLLGSKREEACGPQGALNEMLALSL